VKPSLNRIEKLIYPAHLVEQGSCAAASSHLPKKDRNIAAHLVEQDILRLLLLAAQWPHLIT
jgi:hypothetical protein